ncbi:MAG: hypothetical protein ACTSU4_05750 [Promethearchaeota archaeon]
MGIESFTSFELFYGFIGLIPLTINFILGIRISLKYLTYRKEELITVGLMLVFITSPWWGSAFSFLAILLFNINLSDTSYIIISYGLIPIASLFWIYSFVLLVCPHLKWKIFLVYALFTACYEILFFYYLFTNPSLLAIRVSKLESETQLVVTSFALITMAISVITNFLFMKKSLQSQERIIRWKGKLIFISLLVFILGALLDSIVSLTPLTVLITRIILMVASILSYIGWIMPERIAKYFS